MQGFSGFPEGKTRIVPVPAAFFAELLPAIDHLAEFKATLYAFWSLSRKEGEVRYLVRADFAGDERFMRGLASNPTAAEHALDDALERAVARGTLLQVSIESADGEQTYYFLNTPRGRAAVDGLTRGKWRPSGNADAPIELSMERPNVFTLYEQNIGPLTPMIADSLRDAENSYPAAWLEEAIRIAVANNVRKMRYILAILEDWRSQGKDDRDHRGDSEKSRRRYTEGEFAAYINK